MAKKLIKSVFDMPIYVNLPGGRSMKIPARTPEPVEVEAADLECPEMQFYLKRRNIVEVQQRQSAPVKPSQPAAKTPEEAKAANASAAPTKKMPAKRRSKRQKKINNPQRLKQL